MKANPENIEFVCEDVDHSECLAFSLTGDLYAGGEAGQIYRIDRTEGKPECIAQTDGFALGITLDGNGQIYCCDVGRKEILRCTPQGAISTYAKGTQERPLGTPNYSAFDTEGRLFFTDSGEYWNPSGSIWVKEPGLEARPLTPGQLPFANGLCIDSENSFLYLALSTASQIVRFKLDGAELSGSMELVAQLPEGTVPDGIALDRSRNIWLGCYVPDEIWRIAPGGTIETIMADRSGELLSRPTNIALRSDQVFFANLGGWHLGAFETKVDPLPLNYPEIQ